MIKAVFFDLDGVLVDSETFHQSLTEEFLKLDNSPIPPERFYMLIGSHKSLNHWPKITEGIELNEPLEDFLARLRSFKRRRLDEKDFSTLVFPEVEKTIRTLKNNGIKLACASSSAMPYIKGVLKNGLSDMFDLIVSCDDFEHSKPKPDI